MNENNAAHKDVRRRFRRVKIMTLAMLMELLQCSRSTAQRRLKQWACHTSYNHNGAYYALPETVDFDEHGIWRCDSVCFSKHGNLTQTVTALICNAAAGMSAAELSDVLGVDANSFIGAFARSGKVSREKVGARFVYTSCDKHIGGRQIQQRIANDQCPAPLSTPDAVTVLVELIKSPSLTVAELSRAVRSRAPTASPEAIEQFLGMHGIAAAKKKAPRPLQ